MDGESLLYIIIAIIYLVVSALNAKKKKKEAQNRKQAQPEGQPKKGTTLEDILKEMMDPDAMEEAEEIPEAAPAPPRENMEREWRSPAEIQAEIEEKQRQAQLELERQRRLAAIQESIERKKAIARERRESMNKKLAAHKKEVRTKRVKKSPSESKVNLKQAIIGKIILDRPYE